MAAQNSQDTATDNAENGAAVPRLGDLISEVTDLITGLDDISVEASVLLAEVPEECHRHVENLLHYTRLRTIDIREL